MAVALLRCRSYRMKKDHKGMGEDAKIPAQNREPLLELASYLWVITVRDAACKSFGGGDCVDQV
jgi:hypothetical protein